MEMTMKLVGMPILIMMMIGMQSNTREIYIMLQVNCVHRRQVEDWVTIVYDKQLYPEVIADVSDSGILVDRMKGLPGKNAFVGHPKMIH